MKKLKKVQKKEILNNILEEILFIQDVIYSCKTLDQYNVAIDWSSRWKESRKNYMLKKGFSKQDVNKIYNFKHSKF